MEKIIIIVGQTSSGKSSLGVSLAKQFNGEIVSADSRQVYRGLDYCSGKVTEEEMQGVPHHLLDVANLGEQFSLYDFQTQAYAAIDDILSRGKLPIVVGGTGLYTRSIAQGYNLSKASPNAQLRSKLEALDIQSLIQLCREKNIDCSGEQTKRRLIRLIEKDSPSVPNTPRYDVLELGIRFDREEIYERIKLRLEARMPNMISEIKGLLNSGANAEFLKSLGLEAKMVTQYVLGEFNSYDEFFDLLYKEERHYAKRQQTWYNKENQIVWLDGSADVFASAVENVNKFLKNSKN